ncbi:MAG TPA: phosphatase PAP2 family protein [Jatrophihabitans sp.]|jgi:hypothetical protein
MALRTAPVFKPAVSSVSWAYSQMMRPIHAIGWRTIRYVLGAAYLGYIIDRIVDSGVPTGRETLAKLMVIGLAISVLGRGWKKLLWVIVDWWPFTAVLILYDQSRKFADTAGMPLHMTDIARWENDLFFGHVPTVWLQQHFYSDGHVHWYDAVASLTYSSHFLVTPVLAGVFWFVNRTVFYRYISRVILLSFAGLATYVLFPEAPPWMASQNHVIGEVHRISALGWTYLHASFAHQALESGQNGGANPVAAMPSLHFAFSFLAAMFLAQRIASRWRNLIYLYPVVMALTLVYTGEHYVIDEIAGLAYALAAHFAIRRFEIWWQARQGSKRLTSVAFDETAGLSENHAAEVLEAGEVGETSGAIDTPDTAETNGVPARG